MELQIKVNLFPIEKNGLFGFMDWQGNVVITPQFINVSKFSDGFAAVDHGNDIYSFIYPNGKILIRSDATHQFTLDVDNTRLSFYSDSAFHNGLAKTHMPAGTNMVMGRPMKLYKYGYFDTYGKIVIDPIFDSATPFNDESAMVIMNRQALIINTRGEVIMRDSSSYTISRSFSEGLAVITERATNKEGFVNKSGQIAIAPQFERTGWFSEGVCPVFINHYWGGIDTSGGIVIEPKYSEISPCSEGLLKARIEGGSVYLNKAGEMIFRSTYDSEGDFHEGLAMVYSNKKFGYIDKIGKLVIEPTFDKAQDFSNGLAIVEQGAVWGYINTEGKFIWRSQ